MASTRFKDNEGVEQTLTGLVVRHHVLHPLLGRLKLHQDDLNQNAQAGNIAAAAQMMQAGGAAVGAVADAGAMLRGVQFNSRFVRRVFFADVCS